MFRISTLPHSNVYDTVTFEFFPPEWTTSPPVSLLKSLIVTNFIGRVDFFPLFKVGGTTNGLSLLHIDPNVMWELRLNGSDLLPALLWWYCSCKFDGKTFSVSATCCLKSSQTIVDGTMSSFWLPLALSSISKVIWKGSAIHCKHKFAVKYVTTETYHHLPQTNCPLQVQAALAASSCFCEKRGLERTSFWAVQWSPICRLAEERCRQSQYRS